MILLKKKEQLGGLCCYRIRPVFGNYGVIIRLIPTCHCAVGSSSGRFHIIDPWKQYAAINSRYKCCWSPKGTKTPPIKKQSKTSSCNMNLINLIKEKHADNTNTRESVSASNFGFGYEDVIQQEFHPLKQAFQNMMIPSQLDPFALRWEPC